MDGTWFTPGSNSQIVGLTQGSLRFQGGGGLWTINFQTDGDDEVTLWPTPSEAGLTITADAVIEPTALANPTDEPKVPERFRRALVDYAAAHAFGGEEDNPELRRFYQEEYDVRLSRLRQLRMSREGSGVVQMQVEGWHY